MREITWGWPMTPRAGITTQASATPPGSVPQASSRRGPKLFAPAPAPTVPAVAIASSTAPGPPVRAKNATVRMAPATTMISPWNAWVRSPPTSPESIV